MAALARSKVSIKGKISLENANRFCHNCIKNTLYKKRDYSNSGPLPPLNIPLQGQVVLPGQISDGELKRKMQAIKEVKVTTLSNGIKVASEESFGPFCTLGGI